MKVVCALAAAVLALFDSVQAANIDNGFTQDGTTTYCMGVSTGNGSMGTLNFETLEASNVGRCPVGVALTLTTSDFGVNEPITVKWAAKMVSGLTNAIFPNAIDATTKLPSAVIKSSLFACTSGTNCATNVGGTPTGADGTSTGPFSSDGTKALETNTFTLNAAGDYIIVGLVSLPGDSTLNLEAEEYLVFKKISVVSTDSSTPPSDSPTPSPDSSNTIESVPTASPEDESDEQTQQNSKADSTTSKGATLDSSAKTTTSAANEMDKMNTASTSSGYHNFFKSNGILIIAVVVGCCVIGFAAFAFAICRRKSQSIKDDKGSQPCDMDDRGGKTDITYAATTTARNNNSNKTDTMMDEEGPVAMMPSAKQGLERDSSDGSSLPKSSLDADEYSDKAKYGAVGHGKKARMDASCASNISFAGQSLASMSNFGDSIVSARQKQYLQPNDWNESAPSNRGSCLNLDLSAHGKSSSGRLSTSSNCSEDKASRVTGTSDRDSNRGLGFSMSSRPSDSRLSEDYRVTEELHGSKTPDFSEALDHARQQSEASVDSYGVRTSRSSVDSYSSGISYNREGSRISRFSAASSLDRSSDISTY